MKLRENVEISSLTTMRIGGKARYVAEITELSDVPEVFKFVRENNLPFFILGGGANTIGRDEGFPGVIILNRLKGIFVVDETADEALVKGMGGEVWDDFVEFCSERGYSGIEAMSGIPGTVGAAPVQNIGAYGQDMSQVLESVSAYDTETSEVIELGREELKMGYRSTIFNTGDLAGRYLILSVTVMLENDEHLEPPFYNSLQKYLDENGISDYSPVSIREAVLKIRGDKLPDPEKIASAGSFFKNIYMTAEEAKEFSAKFSEIKVYEKDDGRFMVNTGALIEGAGLAGAKLHGMRVLEGAALVLINDSAKSYADLSAAREEIRSTVFEKYGVKIEQEPVEITGYIDKKA